MNADDDELTLPAIDPADIAAATAAAMRAADAEGLIDIALDVTDTPIGPLTLAATPAGLVKVAFGAHEEYVADALARYLSPRVVALPSRLDPVRRQLDEYFEGRRRRFDIEVDWALSRGFRRAVLQRLYEDVGFGETASYADLASAAGSPRAHRAVGSAMATNPVPIVVPCHRVLRSGGSLGGYGGGVEVKRRLLVLEGSLLA